MGIVFMRIFGVILIIFAISMFLANHLNKPNILTTAIVAACFSAAAFIFAFLDWRTRKKISGLVLATILSSIIFAMAFLSG